MSRHFQLWDTASGNLMATFATEAEALAIVRETVCADGREAVASWALGWEDTRGRGAQIAAGTALAQRALNEIPA